MPRQQVVVELVDLRPVIHGLAVLHFHRSQYVVKNRVKAYVAKAELIHCQLELGLAVIANQRSRVIGPH